MQLMKQISIMLIDDHTLIRETWRSLLSSMENMKIVAECGDGRLAGELAEKMRPEIVLLDINMEPIDGFKVLKIIRKLSPMSKIIGLSMRSEPANVKRFLRLGAKGYVTKNSPRMEMIHAIEEVSKGNIYVCEEAKALMAGQMLAGQTMNDQSPASQSPAGQVPPGLNSLSDRELEVLSLLTAGATSKEIAGKLNISIKTVEVHRHNILKKMKIKNTIALILYVNSQAFEI
jgi:two-component system, NarL family, invasion response regulator UvrY